MLLYCTWKSHPIPLGLPPSFNPCSTYLLLRSRRSKSWKAPLYLHIYVCVYLQTYTHAHIYTYHSICICIIYIYIHAYINIHIYTYIHTLSLSIYIYTFISYIWLVVSWFTVWTVLPENCEATYVVSSQLSEASAVFDSHANRIAFLVLHKSEARSMADCFEWSYHKWPKCVSKLPSFEPFSIYTNDH